MLTRYSPAGLGALATPKNIVRRIILSAIGTDYSATKAIEQLSRINQIRRRSRVICPMLLHDTRLRGVRTVGF